MKPTRTPPPSPPADNSAKEFTAEVLEAEKECKMGLCKRFDSVDDLLASLDE
jgi:hypothetical protein